MTDTLIQEENPQGSESSGQERKIAQELDKLEVRVVAVSQKVLEETNALNPDLDISHQDLDNLFSLTKDFYGASKDVANYLQREAKSVSDELGNVEGYVGAVGFGYPFYALDSEGNPIFVPEISNFLTFTRNLVQEDVRYNTAGWVCPACQEKNSLPDLKTFCKPCDLVKIKPRDVFKALPDVDIAVITDKPGENTEKQIEELINQVGYRQ